MPATLTRHGYWLAAALPLLMPLGWLLRDTAALNPAGFPLWAWLTLPTLYFALPLADLLIGPDRRDPDPAQRSAYTDVAVPVVAALAYLATLPWALATLAAHPPAFGILALLGWTASLANLGGVVAINVAHELTHRRDPWLPKLGGLLLSCVWYPGFKLEHPRWHHVKVATPEDPSSAPLGANVYRQAPRAWWLNTACAWCLAVSDARRAGRPLPALNHEMGAWFLLSAALTVGVYAWLGMLAAAVFVAHGIGAALLLEVINYVE
ncbi:MAG: fatty acid desaturase, partial [Gammaproteobacteria bacterium]